jgi:DNA-binding CsgD family transcriptional regulator
LVWWLQAAPTAEIAAHLGISDQTISGGRM